MRPRPLLLLLLLLLVLLWLLLLLAALPKQAQQVLKVKPVLIVIKGMHHGVRAGFTVEGSH